MKSIQALREQRAEFARQARNMLDQKGDAAWSKEDQAAFDSIDAQIVNVEDQIKAVQKVLDREANERIEFAASEGRKAGGVEIDALAAVAAYMRHGSNVSAEQAIAIRNAMSTGTGSEGGFTVPTEVAQMVIDSLKAFGGMRDAATILRTDSGNTLNFPASDGTAEKGAIVGENAAAALGEMTFSQVALNVYKYSSNKLALPWELVQDSAIDVVAFVVNRLAQRLARATNEHYTVGTGTAQPFGVVSRATSGKVGATGQTVTATYDDIADLFYSVNSAYRGNAKFMMADSTLKVLRKLKDSTGRPLFAASYESGITQGAPDILHGAPVVINDDMPAMAANAKSIIFGDLSKYIIRDVGSAEIRRFDDSAFALNGQVGFCGWQRTGGNLLDSAAVKFYQNSAT